jgi:hypothetical protein
MTVAELVASHVHKDPMSPALAEGYVVSFVAFYEWGFVVSSHRFLHSLLQHYCMEVHNLPSSGILHIMNFVTLCEAYMGIDSHFDLSNHFFRIRRSQDQDMELANLGGVVIHVKPRHGVDPYFSIPMPKLMKGWW